MRNNDASCHLYSAGPYIPRGTVEMSELLKYCYSLHLTCSSAYRPFCKTTTVQKHFQFEFSFRSYWLSLCSVFGPVLFTGRGADQLHNNNISVCNSHKAMALGTFSSIQLQSVVNYQWKT